MQVTVITHDNEFYVVFATRELAVACLAKHGYETEEDWEEQGFQMYHCTVQTEVEAS